MDPDMNREISPFTVPVGGAGMPPPPLPGDLPWLFRARTLAAWALERPEARPA
jgi:hypothetical protein